MENNLINAEYDNFIVEIKNKIRKSQYEAMKAVNTTLINLYWGIGEEIYNQQQEKGWGKSIVEVLSKEIQKEFPEVKGFSASNLWRMRSFYLTYKDIENLAPLVREISWTKNIAIAEKCKDKIESKDLHDCVSCKCRACSIDGGKQYTRIDGNFKYINCINEDGTEEPLIKNNAKVIEAEKRFLNKEV